MSKFKVLVKKSFSIKKALQMMTDDSLYNNIPGFSVVVDDDLKVIGAFTDGDLRRAIFKEQSINMTVESMMSHNPICVVLTEGDTEYEIYSQVMRQLEKLSPHHRIHEVILVNEQGRFYDVIPFSQLINNIVRNKSITIYGLGYVGLTLATVFANNDFVTNCVDQNAEIINNLKNNKIHFFEEGLHSLLEILNTRGLIHFYTQSDNIETDIHVITVGTPIEDEKPQLHDLVSITEVISRNIKYGDLIIYRSTLPVGTTRQMLIPILEKSGLRVGIEFFVAFAPERTVEGKAIEELQSLPQIVGGYSEQCVRKTSQLFKKITQTVIEVESLEAAEMIKLMNNSFRDLVFAFANEAAFVADHFNINAFSLVRAANEGYPRNPIPSPSPGVGGSCLTKDPLLYSNVFAEIKDDAFRPILGKMSRKINNKVSSYILEKLQKYCQLTGKNIDSISIYIIGIAFKGIPETSDIRFSSAIELIESLPNRKNISLFDHVVPNDILTTLNCQVVSQIEDGFVQKDAMLILNNHYQNNKFHLAHALIQMNPAPFFFDGWEMFLAKEVEKMNHTYYATMGYMTKSSS